MVKWNAINQYTKGKKEVFQLISINSRPRDFQAKR